MYLIDLKIPGFATNIAPILQKILNKIEIFFNVKFAALDDQKLGLYKIEVLHNINNLI